MDQSGAPLAVSFMCDINTAGNTGKNQSDCTNCLKCLRYVSKLHRDGHVSKVIAFCSTPAPSKTHKNTTTFSHLLKNLALKRQWQHS